MTTPRPDQHHGVHHSGPGGSRSGSGDLSASLGYPGVPPAVPNCKSAQALRRSIAGAGLFFGFPSAGRVWTVTLSYAVNSFAGFSAPAFFAATITTNLAALPLAVVELSLATTPDKATGTCVVSYNGLPVVGGDSLILNINGGVTVAGANQEASAVVLYSLP